MPPPATATDSTPTTKIAIAAGAVLSTAAVLLSRRRLGMSWIPTSASALALAEKRILECVRTPLRQMMVPIGDSLVINTVAASRSHVINHSGMWRERDPVLLVHGFGGGLGLWCENIDFLASHMDVYAVDLLGFGRSSRPPFTGSTPDAIRFFTEPLERWRQRMGLNRLALIGHSLGAYVASVYALQHPRVVSRLLLAAPFGLRRGVDHAAERRLEGVMARALLQRVSPQALLRATGPLGPVLLGRVRDDGTRYGRYADDRVLQYVYHLNAADGSGEYAFLALQEGFGMVREPLLPELRQLRCPLTVVLGADDCIPLWLADDVRRTVPGARVAVMRGAGHHMYATHADAFNRVALAALDA